jgi:hypothetical protein
LTHNFTIVDPVGVKHTFPVIDSFIVIFITQDTFDIQNFNIIPDHIGFVMQITIGNVVRSKEMGFWRVFDALVITLIDMVSINT